MVAAINKWDPWFVKEYSPTSYAMPRQSPSMSSISTAFTESLHLRICDSVSSLGLSLQVPLHPYPNPNKGLSNPNPNCEQWNMANFFSWRGFTQQKKHMQIILSELTLTRSHCEQNTSYCLAAFHKFRRHTDLIHMSQDRHHCHNVDHQHIFQYNVCGKPSFITIWLI